MVRLLPSPEPRSVVARRASRFTSPGAGRADLSLRERWGMVWVAFATEAAPNASLSRRERVPRAPRGG